MKSSWISSSHRLFVSVGFGVALVLLLFAVSQARAQGPIPHDIVFLIDNSQSVHTGEGTPDRQPTDPAQVRLRLPYFVINLLNLTPASAYQRVGIISFSGSTKTLMPLTSVPDWSKADFAEIRAVNQAGGTDFATALDAALEMLDADCSPDVRHCDVVMVTDGIFERYRAGRDQQAVEDDLQSLRSRGVSVHLLAFEMGDPKWQEFLTNGLVSTYQPNVISIPPDQVYGAVLRGLGVETLLTSLSPVEVAGEETIVLTIQDFHTWTRYQVLADSPLTVTFLYAGQTMTPVVAGTEYTLFQPQAGEWGVRLQGNGLVYYHQTGAGVADLSLYLREPERILPLGEDVTVYAGLAAGGAPVTNLAPFTVTATINGAADTIGPLKLELDETIGLLATAVPSDWFKDGTYTVTLAAQSSIPNLTVQPATGQFEIVALPTLTMIVTQTELLQSEQPVHAIVTIGNWKPGYVPKLRFYGSEGEKVVMPAWNTQGAGVFTAMITAPADIRSSFAVVAELEGSTETSADELFGSIQTVPQLVEYPSAPQGIATTSYPIWLLIPLCAVLAIGVYGWWRFDGINKQRRRARRIERLRDEVEALARMVSEIPEEPSPIVESWNV